MNVLLLSLIITTNHSTTGRNNSLMKIVHLFLLFETPGPIQRNIWKYNFSLCNDFHICHYRRKIRGSKSKFCVRIFPVVYLICRFKKSGSNL